MGRTFDSHVVVDALTAALEAMAYGKRKECPNEEEYYRHDCCASSEWTCPYMPDDPDPLTTPGAHHTERHFGAVVVGVKPDGTKHVDEGCYGWCWARKAEELLRKEGWNV